MRCSLLENACPAHKGGYVRMLSHGSVFTNTTVVTATVIPYNRSELSVFKATSCPPHPMISSDPHQHPVCHRPQSTAQKSGCRKGTSLPRFSWQRTSRPGARTQIFWLQTLLPLRHELPGDGGLLRHRTPKALPSLWGESRGWDTAFLHILLCAHSDDTDVFQNRVRSPSNNACLNLPELQKDQN